MKAFKLWFLSGIVCLVNIAAFPQAANEQGIKPYGSYHGGDIDATNVSNHHLELRIPVLSYPQRGTALKLSFIARFHNAVWYEHTDCVSTTSICIHTWEFDGQPNVQVANELGLPFVDQQLVSGGSTSSPVYSYSVRMADESQHPLGNISGTLFETVNATAIKWDSSTQTVTMPNGARYVGIFGSAPVLEDANGNQIVFNGGTITDTMGRTIPSRTSTQDYTGCTGSLPISSASLWTVPGSNSGSNTFKLCFAQVKIYTHHWTLKNTSTNTYIEPNGLFSMLQSIVLPDQTAWTFDYSQPDGTGVNWGDLVKVTYPSGGSIAYTWGHSQGCHLPAGAPGSWSGGVSKRTVDAHDGSPSHDWLYFSGPLAGQTIVRDPLLNDTVHTFTDLNKSCSLYETKTEYYNGAQSGGTLIKTLTTDYSWASVGGSHPPINVVPIRKTTLWPNGQVKKTEFSYDSGFTYGGSTNAIYGKQTSVNEFDYGPGVPGALLKSTQTRYKWQSSAGSQYQAFNVLDVPTTTTLLDGGGNAVSLTTIGYDEAVPGGSGISTSHDLSPPNGNTRGNPTSTSRWLSGSTVSTPNCPVTVSNGSLTSTKTYLDTGMVSQIKDTCLQQTTLQYSSLYYGAYLTSSCDALNHCTTMDYDFNTGAIAGITDPNGQTTGKKTTHTYDDIGRLIGITYPDGGQTNAFYPNPTTVEVKKLQDSTAGVWIDSYSYFDGLLRPKQSRLVDPEGDVYTDTTYDELGRVSTVSNPHRSVTAPTDGITTTHYDATGRVVSVTHPDGNVLKTNYSDPGVVTLIDETDRQRRETFDALGRLVKLEEPGSAGAGSKAAASLVIGGTLQSKPATNATPGTGSVTFNGSVQSKPNPPARPGSVSITITGGEASTVVDPCANQGVDPTLGGGGNGQSCPQTLYDTGYVIITVNGHSDSTYYGAGSDSTTIAAGLAVAFNGDSASPVTATASGSIVSFTSKASGGASNYSFSATSATNDATDFGGPSFATSVTSGTLSGGTNAGPIVYDASTCSTTINGTAYSATFGQSDTAATIASKLAAAVSAGTVASASASGSTISLTSKTGGVAANYSFNASCSYNSSMFGGPSFTTGVSGSSLTGGADALPAATDAGTVTLSIAGLSATANYGNGVGQDTTAAAVAADLVAQMQAQLPSANPPFSVSVPAGAATIAINWSTPGVAGNVAVNAASSTTQTARFSAPSFAGCTISANPQNCGMSLSGGTDPYSLDTATPWPTLYSYDLLGNLLRVEQHGSSTDSTQWRVRTFQYDSLSRLTQSNNPEAGQINYAYDADGNVITRKDARGLTITYSYDQVNRLFQKAFSDSTPAAIFGYDQTNLWGVNLSNTIGRLSSTSAGATGSIVSYDAMGRPIAESVCLPSNCGTGNYAISAQFDLAGHLTSLSYPSGRTVTSGYNSAGRALNSVFSAFGGVSANYAYYRVPQASTAATWGYNPDGSLHLGTFANGISETYGYNNRGQLNAITASGSSRTWLSKIYGLYDTYSHNNGNIWSIVDGISSTRNQSYQYDALGRVTSGSQQDGAFNQTFNYDSWGNMTTSGTNNFNPLYDGNNRIIGAASNCTPTTPYCYDAAGNLLNDASHQYVYDGDSRIASVDAIGATYTYGAGGERVRKDTGGKGTEYVDFQGTAIAEKDISSGYWSDYVFFNGRRIARANNYEHQLHISGQECANCGSQWYQYNFTNLGSLAGHTIQSGDSLRWLQWQNTGSAGGVVISFTDGTDTCCNGGISLTDQNGEAITRSSSVNQWNYRMVSLSSMAGKTISQVRLYVDGTTQPGQWDIYYQDVAFTGADGTIQPLFSQNATIPGMSGFGSTGTTQTSATINDCSGTACGPMTTTTYFHDDQIGSSRLLSAGYGYPVWQGTFTPFGQEVSPQITSNHYKFSGKERGEATEGGLDYFGARSYSSTLGRWMTPDWSDAPSAVPYAKLTDPQSLNLYSYVTDDPLSHTDLDGHFQMKAASGACPNNNGDTCEPFSMPSCPAGATNCESGKGYGYTEINQWNDTVTVSQSSYTKTTNSDGTVTYSSTTVTATFSMNEKTAGQFLGASAVTSTVTRDPKSGSDSSAPVNGKTQAINFGDASKAFRGFGVSLGAIQSTAHPDALALFPKTVAKDAKNHPGKYIAAGASISSIGLGAAGYAVAAGTVRIVGLVGGLYEALTHWR